MVPQTVVESSMVSTGREELREELPMPHLVMISPINRMEYAYSR